MKFCLSLLLSIFLFNSAKSQTLEGDVLLQILNKPVSNPLFQELKEKESFITDAWNTGFNIYANVKDNYVVELEFQNGKKKYSSQERYGYYKKQLPLQLSFSMSAGDFERKLGTPVYESTAMNFTDYEYQNNVLRIFFENDKPVSISYRKKEGSAEYLTPIKTAPPMEELITTGSGSWIIELDNRGNADVNWSSLKQLITGSKNFKQFAGKDSVDYIGQVYYSTDSKILGFDRSAIKRIKRNGQWFYEAFYKIKTDSNLARKTFFSVYDALKKVIKDNTGDDFILAAVAKDYISESPMNWMAQWTLYSNYKVLPPGLGKLKIGFMLSGMTQFMEKTKMEYTFKLYIFQDDLEWDFYTWDKPL